MNDVTKLPTALVLDRPSARYLPLYSVLQATSDILGKDTCYRVRTCAFLAFIQEKSYMSDFYSSATQLDYDCTMERPKLASKPRLLDPVIVFVADSLPHRLRCSHNPCVWVLDLALTVQPVEARSLYDWGSGSL